MEQFTHLFPKTCPCNEILAVDVERERSYHSWIAKDALMAISCIQGLVNREESKKIYLINYPNEHDWDIYPSDQQALEQEGFFPVPHSYAKLDNTKTFPALDFLLKEYHHKIKGVVLCPPLTELVCDGAIMAAVTACAQLSAIPVSQHMHLLIKEAGYDFPVLDDTRNLKTNIEAFDWSYENYFNDKVNPMYIGHHSITAFGGRLEDQFTSIYDYFMATCPFVFCLNGNYPEERAKLNQILNESNYPLSTPVLGLPVDEGEGLETIEEIGYYFVIANVHNFSCTSAFPSDLSLVPKLPEPKVYELDQNDVALSFYVTDGDSLAFPAFHHYHDMVDTPKSDVPIGWSFNPLTFTLYPSMFYWRWQYRTDIYEPVLDWNDQRQMGTLQRMSPKSWDICCGQIKNYFEKLGMYSTNYFFGDINFIQQIEPVCQIKGYGSDPGYLTKIARVNDSVSISLTGTVTDTSVRQMVENVEAAMSYQQSGNRPTYVMLVNGSGCVRHHNGESAYRAGETVRRLREKYPDKRFVLMRPCDMAVSYLNHEKKRKGE